MGSHTEIHATSRATDEFLGPGLMVPEWPASQLQPLCTASPDDPRKPSGGRNGVKRTSLI